jgi:hypothetical protein
MLFAGVGVACRDGVQRLRVRMLMAPEQAHGALALRARTGGHCGCADHADGHANRCTQASAGLRTDWTS